jgi:hypothetical protein
MAAAVVLRGDYDAQICMVETRSALHRQGVTVPGPEGRRLIEHQARRRKKGPAADLPSSKDFRFRIQPEGTPSGQRGLWGHMSSRPRAAGKRREGLLAHRSRPLLADIWLRP